MIDKINCNCNCNYNINFRSANFIKHTKKMPKMKLYEEFHFQPELKRKNIIKSFVNNIVNNVLKKFGI